MIKSDEAYEIAKTHGQEPKVTTKRKKDIAGISTLMSEVVPKPGGREAKTSGKGPNNTLLQQ
jgi:hypothetical protein